MCENEAHVLIVSNDAVNEDTYSCFRHVGDLISPGFNTVSTIDKD